MRKLLVGMAVVGGLGAGLVLLARTATRPPVEAAVSGQQVVRVGRREVGSAVRATGIVKPSVGAEVRVGSRVSGVVERLYVRVGDQVAKGQLLATLDDRELRSRHYEARAALAVADADLRYAAADLARRRELQRGGVLAASELDLAERAFAVAEQRQAQAAAAVRQATTQLGYTRIAAPIPGVVASVSTQEGETVAASFASPTFVTLVDLTRLEVWAYVDETDIGRVTPGQQARFTVDTYGDEELPGEVTAIYPQAEIRDNVVNYVAVVRFATPPGRTLRPEMTAAVRIDLAGRRDVLALPLGAVRREGGATFVLLRRGATTERRPVTLGTRGDRDWEVTAGLAEGDEVVVGELAPAEQ